MMRARTISIDAISITAPSAITDSSNNVSVCCVGNTRSNICIM